MSRCAVGIGEGQCRGHGAADPDHLVGRKWPFLLQPLPDVAAVDERHGEPEEIHRAASHRNGGHTGVEHTEDVGMLEPGGDPDLPPEAVGAHGGSEVGIEQLQRDGAPRMVVREIHGSHSAAAQLPLDGVPSGERRLELLAEIGLQGCL